MARREACSREVGRELQPGETATDKQDPAARGANPGASQLSHPAMKQSADFIETRSPASSRSRCSSRLVTSSGPRELPGAARGAAEDDGGDAGWPSSPSQPCPRSQRAHICFQKRWIEALPRSGGAGLEPTQLPQSPAHHFYPLACPFPCNIPAGPFLLCLSRCFICREGGWILPSLVGWGAGTRQHAQGSAPCPHAGWYWSSSPDGGEGFSPKVLICPSRLQQAQAWLAAGVPVTGNG